VGLLHNLIVRIRGDSTQLDSTLKKTESSIGRWSKKIGAYIAAAFVASAVVIATFGKHIIGLAAKAEGIKTAFDNLNDPNLLNDLRRATRGTVENVVLMQKAIQAKNFKIPLEQLATYFEFATKRAIQTGESVDYLVESIITGIGRKSVLVMDNLGISAVELQDEVKKTGDFTTAAGVIIRRELESMGDVADTTVIRFARLKTAWQDFMTELGGKVTASKLFADFMKGLETATSWLKGKPSLFEGMSKEQLIAQKGILEKQREQLELGRKALLQEQDKITLWKWITGETKDYSKLLKSNTEDLKNNKQQLEEILNLLNKIGSAAGGGGEGGVAEKPYEWMTLPVPRIPKISKGIPILPGLQKGSKPINAVEDMTQALYAQQQAVSILSNSFNALFSSTSGGFKAMIDSMIMDFKRLIAEILAKAAVLFLIRTLFPGTSIGAAATTGLMGMFGSKPFGMASGGTVPPGYPNDSFITGLSSGEKVLQAGQAQTIKIEPKEIRVKGRDIVIVMRRAGIQN